MTTLEDIFLNAQKGIEKILKKHFAKEYEEIETFKGIHYLTFLPFKYCSYFLFFDEKKSYISSTGLKKLEVLKAHLKMVKRIIGALPEPEKVLLDRKTINPSDSLICYLIMINNFINTIDEVLKAITLTKGRKKKRLYAFIEELGEDYKFVTGIEPKLSRDIYGKPTGKFYDFAKDVLAYFGLDSKVNIEHAIRAFPKELGTPDFFFR